MRQPNYYRNGKLRKVGPVLTRRLMDAQMQAILSTKPGQAIFIPSGRGLFPKFGGVM